MGDTVTREKILPPKRTAKMSMRKRKRTCPHSEAQDGVCGCPEFWEVIQSPQQPRSICPSATRDTPVMTLSTSFTDYKTIKSPSPSPFGPPKETCFFWYHDQCRRENCHFAHETNITWPIFAPPGFIHFEPCNLPLCPLRKDLVTMHHAKPLEKKGFWLDGQLDGAVFNRTATAEAITDGENNFNTNASGEEDKEASGTSFLGTRFAPAGSDSDPESEDLNEQSTNEEAVMHAIASLEKQDLEYPNKLRLTTRAPSPSYSAFLDMADLAFIPPSSEAGDEQPMQSISHLGTLGKRQCSNEVEDHFNNKEHKKRESTPDLHGFVSILERKRHTTHWDLKLLPKRISNPVLHADPAHELPNKPGPLSKAPLAHVRPPKNPSAGLNRHFNPPRGPRSQHQNRLICFHWYHKGYCKPKRQVRQGNQCGYLHTLETPSPVVSRPLHVMDHAGCSLPLCPIAMVDQANRQPGNNNVYGTSVEPHTKHTPKTQLKLEYPSSSYDYSFSPHNSVALGRSLEGGEVLRSPPKLTGPRKKRFKQQGQGVRQRKANHGASPETSNEMLEKKKAMKKERDRRRRQKRRERRAAYTKVAPSSIQQQCESVDLSQPVFRAMAASSHIPSSSDVTTIPARRCEEPKGLLQVLHAPSFFDKDVHMGKGQEVAKPKTRQFQSTNWTLTRFSGPLSVPGVRTETEERQRSVESVTNMNRLMSSNPQKWYPPLTAQYKRFGDRPMVLGTTARTTPVAQQQPNHEEGLESLRHYIERDSQDRGHGDDVYGTYQWKENRQGIAKPSVLVDYSLPEGEARLDWDTDLVRRLFGEIE